MPRQILVPLDGSALSERALPYAESLANTTQARIVLLRAVESYALIGRARSQARVAAMLEAEGYLDAVASTLRERGATVDIALPYGNAADAIADEVALRGIELVVMATHGRGGLGRFAYGSVAARVLHEAEVPVLLVRAWRERSGEVFAPVPQIVVSLDGSRFAEAALPVARDLAQALGGQLSFVQAVAPPEAFYVAEMAYTAYDPTTELAAARSYLRRYVDEERAAGRAAQALVEVAVPGDLIVEVARANQASLIVMATHGRSGLGRLVLGSVADAVLRQGTTPLLLVRPPDDATEPVDAASAATQE